MKNILFIKFLFIPLLLFSQGPWDFINSTDSWVASNYSSISASTDASHATFTITDSGDGNGSSANPNLSNTSASVNTSYGNILAVTIQNNTLNARLRVILNRSSAGTTTYTNVDITTQDSGFKTYLIDMSGSSAWTGTVDDITLRFQTDSSHNQSKAGTIYIGKIQVTMSSDTSVSDFTVASGTTLIIETGGSLTVTGTLTNNGSIVMNSSSSDYSSLIAGAKAGSGTYSYKRHTASSDTADLISSPFSGQTFSNLLTNNDGMLITNPSDATEYLFSTFNRNTGDYANFDSDTDGSTTLDAGVGYRAGTNSKTSDLFFSQYGEGSGNNKYLEIFNATGASVDLSAYDVQIHFNGNTSSSTGNIKDLGTGTLANNDVLVVAHSSAGADLSSYADITSNIGFNGDDAVTLIKTVSGSTSVIDVIGQIGSDPGSGWSVAGTSNATKDKSLTRKNSVTGPNATALGSFGSNTTDSEWIVTAQNSKWEDLILHNGGSGNELITFAGTFSVSNETEAISIGSNGAYGKWNLVGNPFPSYIDLQHFYTDNSSNFDNTYNAIYSYNGTAWTLYNNSNYSGIYISPGQGFFVAAGGSNNISFDTDMRSVSGTDDFISGDNMENTEVELRIYNDNYSIGNTKLFFEQNLVLGLDIGWDAGSFSQSDAIMTRLIEDDEGHGMAINAMGLDAMENAVIPLVINQSAGQEFRVNLHTATIPDPNVYLEDVEEGTFTNLYEGDFVLTPTSDLEGVGRFFIHMSADTMSNEDVSTSLLNAYKEVDASFITIEGLATQTNETKVSLYNILGREVLSTTLNNNMNTQTISTVGMASGIYVIELESGTDRLTKKLIIQ